MPAVGVLPGAGGYLLVVLGDAFAWPDADRWFSPFTHVAPVPAEPFDVPGASGMLAIVVLLAIAGCWWYARRDLPT